MKCGGHVHLSTNPNSLTFSITCATNIFETFRETDAVWRTNLNTCSCLKLAYLVTQTQQAIFSVIFLRIVGINPPEKCALVVERVEGFTV